MFDTDNKTLMSLNGGLKDSIPSHPVGVKLTVLDNGLTLIIREDHSAPVVSAQAWCKAGSIHEGSWLGAGLSHVLEHMLFKGTTTRPPGMIDQEIQDAGGNMNAYTSFDRTVYYINVPNTGARIAVDVLCDIMQNATLPAEELEKEKQVILREMDMNHDDPARKSSRRLFETAYVRSPYRYTIIGYSDIFNKLQREDVLAYYRQQYAPNNIVFVVVGDIKTVEVEEQIREAYKGVVAKPLPPQVLPEEPRQVAPRDLIEGAPIELAYIHCSWHIPDVRHPDLPALDVLSVLLGVGRSSRLYQQLREKQGLVQSIDAWTYNPGNPGLFGISALVDAPQFEDAKKGIFLQLEQIKNDLVAPEEIQKAVKQFISATLSSRKTMQGQAQDLGGCWFSVNDLNFSERYLHAVKQVTPQDIQRVALHYLTSENRTFFALVPENSVGQKQTSQEILPDSPIQKQQLSNGLRLLIKEDHRLPFVQLRLVFQGGVLAETSQKNGLTLLLAKMMLKGTQTRSSEQIASEIESVGGSIDCYGGNNSVGITSEVLSCDLELALNLISDVIQNPLFPESELQLEQQMQLANLKAIKDHLLQCASRNMRKALFGTVGYGLDVNGTEESILSISLDDLRNFHRQIIMPENAVFAIFGDIDSSSIVEKVEKAFTGWNAFGINKSPLPVINPISGIQRLLETRDKKQAVLITGFLGSTMDNPDRYALELLQEALSDLGSRLFVRIREKLGLAYYVGAQNFLGLVPGYFAFYVGTVPEKVEKVESEIFQEIDLLNSEGITSEELKRAKAKVIGHKKISRQDLGSLAMTVALDELYGLGFSIIDIEDAKYEAVTLNDVQVVIQKYLNPANAIISVIRPESIVPQNVDAAVNTDSETKSQT